MVRRLLICVLVSVGLLAASAPAPAVAATKHARAARLGVRVVKANGRSAGRTRLSIRRAGHATPHLSRTTNRHGRYTSRSLPAGTYTVTARRHGLRSATGTVTVNGAGTHRMTIRMAASAAVARGAVVVARPAHARAAHALGTKSAAKKAGRSAKPTAKPAANPAAVKTRPF